MYKKRSRRPPIFVSAGIVTMSVSKMTFICLDFLIYLNILVILNALIKVVEAPKSNLRRIEIMLETIETMTITKSKMFPPSLKYFGGPNAISLNKASKKKIPAKL